jgi:hypothetical protein
LLENKPKEKEDTFKGFAERRSKWCTNKVYIRLSSP